MGDKPSERAPGGSPALSFLLAGAKAIILIVSLLAMFIVGWSVWQWYRPEHFFNAVNRFGLEQLYAARTGCRGSCLPDWHVSMLGEVFDPGEERVQIVRRLADAGYEVWYDEGGKIGYILRGAGTGALFACDSHFIVDLTFDPSDHLVAADSIGSGTCL